MMIKGCSMTLTQFIRKYKGQKVDFDENSVVSVWTCTDSIAKMF